MLAGHSVEEKRLFRSVVTDVGGAIVENIRDVVSLLRQHALDALVIGEAIDDFSALRLIRSARRLDPDLVVLVERPVTADSLRRALSDLIRFQPHVRM